MTPPDYNLDHGTGAVTFVTSDEEDIAATKGKQYSARMTSREFLGCNSTQEVDQVDQITRTLTSMSHL